MVAMFHRIEQRRLIDSDGIADGASIFFYESNTSTLAPIYSDADLSVPMANPVEVDAGAAVPNIYLDSEVEYRRVIEYLDGTTEEVDPYVEWTSGPPATLVAFTPGGTGSTSRPVETKLREIEISATDWLPVGYVLDGSVDYTTQLQAGYDYVSSIKGGIYKFPAGTFKCNLIMKDYVTVRGAGQDETIFIPAINEHVFRTDTGVSTVRIALEKLRITGNLAYTTKDGIHLETTGVHFVDSVHLREVEVQNCGRSGLFIKGTDNVGPFVQRVFLDDVVLQYNNTSNLRVVGSVFECSAKDSAILHTVVVDGTANNIHFEDDGAGHFPAQFTFTNCIMGNNPAYTANVNAPAVYIRAGSNINFFGCNIEGAEPAIETEMYALAEGFSYVGGKVANTKNVTTIFKLGTGYKVKIDQVRIDGGGSVTATSIVLLNGGSMSDYRGLDIGENYINCLYTNYILDAGAYTQTIASGDITLYRKQMALIAEGGAADDLVNIKNINGSLTAFKHGERITLGLQAGSANITIKNTGNINLNGGSDLLLDNTRKLVVLEFIRHTAEWHQVGGCT